MTMSIGRTTTRTSAQIAADRAQNEVWASKGASIAATNPAVAAMRATLPDELNKRGFDVGTGVSIGSYATGPDSDLARETLLPGARTGFDLGRFQQFGISKANLAATGNPMVDAGQLVASGIIGSGASPDQKAGAMAVVANNPESRAGAVNAIEANKGIFTKILEFFGLA